MNLKRLTTVILALLLSALLLVGCNSAETTNKWVAADSYDGAFSETGYFYLAEGYLYYVDFSTGIHVCLCPKVGCLHNNSGVCEGWVNGVEAQMFYWDNKVYYLGLDQYGTHLYRRNTDGTGLAAVATLCEEYIEKEKNTHISFGKKVVSGGYLHYTAELRVYEVVEGVNTSRYLYTLLQQLDLQTGKEKTLLKKENGISLVAANGSSVRYRVGDSIGEVDIDNPGAIAEAYKETKVQITQMDTAAGTEEVLLETTKFDFYSLEFYSGDKMFYLTYESNDDFSGVYRVYDISTGEDSFFHEGAIQNLIAGRYSLSKGYDAQAEYVLLDLQTGKQLPCPAFYDGSHIIRVVSASDDAVILRRNPIAENINERIWFYVPVAALADGLQEKDCIDFYIKKNS